MKRRILVELDSHETTTPSFYLDVFGFARDRETTQRVGRWQDLVTQPTEPGTSDG